MSEQTLKEDTQAVRSVECLVNGRVMVDLRQVASVEPLGRITMRSGKVHDAWEAEIFMNEYRWFLEQENRGNRGPAWTLTPGSQQSHV